jgi:hypothetical protein
MYDTIRKLHLYTGLVVMAFLMMYFASGYVIVHRPWFGGEAARPAATVRSESLAGYAGDRSPHAIARQFGLSGRVAAAQDAKGVVRFNVVRPGTIRQIEIRGDDVTITTRPENAAGVLAQLHRVHGYGGGWAWNSVAVFSDLSGVACIGFALSGVYLWWKTAKRKIWGVLCLAISIAYGGGMVLYLMYAR